MCFVCKSQSHCLSDTAEQEEFTMNENYMVGFKYLETQIFTYENVL